MNRQRFLRAAGDWAIGIAAAIVVILLGLFFFEQATTPAKAHLWYPSQCCNEKDCRQLDADDVEVVFGEGYFIKSLKVLVPFDKMNSSPDGQFHVCSYSIKADSSSVRERARTQPRCGEGACIRSAYQKNFPEMDASNWCVFGRGLF